MASAGGHWKKGRFATRNNRMARAAGLAWDVQQRIDKLDARIRASQPQVGKLYQTRDYNKMMTDLKKLRGQLATLRNRKIWLNNVASGIS